MTVTDNGKKAPERIIMGQRLLLIVTSIVPLEVFPSTVSFRQTINSWAADEQIESFVSVP